jgi:hypothetical protein
MTSLRSFTSSYSPMFALAVVVLGLYAMAISIGVSMGSSNQHVATGSSYRIFFVPSSVK